MKKIELKELTRQWESETHKDVGIGKAFGFLMHRINELIDEVEKLRATTTGQDMQITALVLEVEKLKAEKKVGYPYDSTSLLDKEK